MFHSARIKLTAWYLAIIMAISLMFSIGMYRVLSFEINRMEEASRARMERRLLQRYFFPQLDNDTPFEPSFLQDLELIDETKRRILSNLVFVNGVIFVVSGVFGYVLAGRTLAPIQMMVDEQCRFITDASHELKTPLTSLKSMFEVYLRDKHKTLPEAETVISDSLSEVNRMQTLAESLLTSIKGQVSSNIIQKTSVDLAHCIKEAVKKIEALAKEKKITITQDVKGIVIGEHQMLVNCFVILLDNAIKYSNTSGFVSIKTHRKKGYVAVSVKDEGVGISKDDMSHIFDRFYRADRARTKTGENGGFGLGLSIAKQMIESLGGSISVTSTGVRKGSVFTVQLPSEDFQGRVVS